MGAAVAATVLFSFSVICGGKSARLLGASSANFWRLVLAVIWLAAWAYGWGGGWRGESRWWFFWSGVIGFGLGDVAFFQALPRLGSRLTVLLTQCLAAPLGALTEFIWMRATLSFWQLLFGAVILAGVALALASGDKAQTSHSGFRFGILLAIAAAFGQAMGAVLSRKAFLVAEMSGQDIDGGTAAYQRILGGLLFGGVVYSLVVLRQVRRHCCGPSAVGPSMWQRMGLHFKRAWMWVLLNSLAGPAIGVAFYQLALKTTQTGVVLPIVATTPLVVIPFAWYMEGDRPSRQSLAGGVIAVIGAIALSRAS